MKKKTARIVSKPLSVTFLSEADKIQGWFYPAAGNAGKAPFPTVILIPGYLPGKKDCLNLGSRLRKAGINALHFTYRGTWKSEGTFTHLTSLADVGSAITFLKSPKVAKKLKVDPANIILAGYSFGGGMALLGSLKDASIHKVVSIAGANLGELARQCLEDEEFRKGGEQYHDQTYADGSMARGIGGKAFVDLVIQTKDEFDLLKYSDALAVKDILLIGAWQDKDATIERYILPIYRALQKSGAGKLGIQVYAVDHSFSGVKRQLATRIIKWIKAN